VADAIILLLKSCSSCVHTLTTDNGKEFAQHERIAEKLKADFYFAHPYSSWERGANENMNGLIRQFFPKKMSFESIKKRDIKKAQDYLNHRPRKCLGFKTPFEVFKNELQLANSAVALKVESANDKVSRSGLDRCLRRHGVSRLADLIPREEPDKTPHKAFKEYQPGFIHVDVKYLPQMPDEASRSYLFAAIDRASRWVYVEILPNKSASHASAFLKRLIKAAPFTITKVLTQCH
jgi:IS30 family transposase